MPTDEFVNAGARRFHHRQKPHGLVIRCLAVHHRLRRQSRAQITPRTGYDPKAPHDVVIHLAAAPIHLRVHRGEIVLHINPLADYLRSGQDYLEQEVGRVFPVIIRVQEDAAG